MSLKAQVKYGWGDGEGGEGELGTEAETSSLYAAGGLEQAEPEREEGKREQVSWEEKKEGSKCGKRKGGGTKYYWKKLEKDSRKKKKKKRK